MSFVIGCDIGSQSLKGVLLSSEGRMVAVASARYDMHFPQPGYAEQDPSAWLEALSQVTRDLLAGSGVAPDGIGAISLAAQLDGCVPVGVDGQVLGAAVIWMDRRATAECDALLERVSADEVFDITGLNVDAAHVAPKVIWLRNQVRSVFDDAEWFPSPASFVVQWLCGARVVDRTNASSTMLYDVRQRQWSHKLLEAAELVPEMFGEVVGSSDVVGTLRPEAAESLGLRVGTNVVAGCGDDHGGCLGAGLVRAGILCDVVGTAEPVAATSASPVFDSRRLVETHDHAVPGLWLIENPGFVSGGSVRWYAELIDVADATELMAIAGEAPAGCDGVLFLPCLSGATAPVWDDEARGAFVGLALSHGRSHLIRAVLEGCAFALRDIADRLAELGTVTESEVRIVGGGARSPLWPQIKADVTGRPVRAVIGGEATAAGAAMLAGVAQRHFGSLVEAAGAVVGLGSVYEPRSEFGALYEERYQKYLETFYALHSPGGRP